jgi:hypothetical protein
MFHRFPAESNPTGRRKAGYQNIPAEITGTFQRYLAQTHRSAGREGGGNPTELEGFS